MKLRAMSIILLLVAGCALELCTSSAHIRQDSLRSAKQDAVGPKLQFTTDVIERKQYPSGYVGFTLRLTFKNTGSTPLILSKQCFLLRVMVSRGYEAATAKRYESVSTSEYMGAIPPRDEPLDIADFVTLKPGEEYTLDKGIGSFKVQEGEGIPPKGEFARGEHYLQLDVSTWSYLSDPARFRRKWRSQGFLWYETLRSQPMSFTL